MSDLSPVDFRVPPGPAKAAQHLMRAVAAIVFVGIALAGVFVAAGGFTWAVREGESVRLPVLIAGASLAAGGLTFLGALRAGWLQGWPPRHDSKVIVGGLFMAVAGTALTFL
ncbi:MAG TPA: hypothetical protein VF142_01785 [Longimicrobium sp.]